MYQTVFARDFSNAPYKIGYGKPPLPRYLQARIAAAQKEEQEINTVQKKLPKKMNNLFGRRMVAVDRMRREILEIGEILFFEDLNSLKTIIREKDIPKKHSSIKVMFAACTLKAMAEGDLRSLETLLNRFVGKPVEQFSLLARVSSADQEQADNKVVVMLPKKDFL